MINPPYRRSEIQAELLGTTTWGVRKVGHSLKLLKLILSKTFQASSHSKVLCSLNFPLPALTLVGPRDFSSRFRAIVQKH